MREWCEALADHLGQQSLGLWAPVVRDLSLERLVNAPHGDLSRWLEALDNLPSVNARGQLSSGTITLYANNFDDRQTPVMVDALKQLMPWRKGPFNFFGTHIDTEWRSDWKWRRVAPHISPLSGRQVLDVGCGSGYHGWRMAGAGARFVLGIDPTLLYLMQYLAVKRYLPETPFAFAPVRLEEMPLGVESFDTVFSMGVLYHRRSPLDHLLELAAALRPGGELVLETLVVEGDDTRLLMPRDRYAAMRNVFFLPSPNMLALWLERCGFEQVRVVDVTPTTVQEQRSTDWMTFQSLPDFLDPDDSSLTREGYPAPVRAVVVGQKASG